MRGWEGGCEGDDDQKEGESVHFSFKEAWYWGVCDRIVFE